MARKAYNTKHVLHFQFDPSCEMESLEFDGICLGYGNSWDCHCEDRIDAVSKVLKVLKVPFKTIEDLRWNWEDENG